MSFEMLFISIVTSWLVLGVSTWLYYRLTDKIFLRPGLIAIPIFILFGPFFAARAIIEARIEDEK